MSVKMEQRVKIAIKKAISALVCIMMVAATFPVHMLNSAVFAKDDEINVSVPADISLFKTNVNDNLTVDKLKDKKIINILFDKDFTVDFSKFKTFTESGGSKEILSDDNTTFTSDNNVKVFKNASGTLAVLDFDKKTYSSGGLCFPYTSTDGKTFNLNLMGIESSITLSDDGKTLLALGGVSFDLSSDIKCFKSSSGAIFTLDTDGSLKLMSTIQLALSGGQPIILSGLDDLKVEVAPAAGTGSKNFVFTGTRGDSLTFTLPDDDKTLTLTAFKGSDNQIYNLDNNIDIDKFSMGEGYIFNFGGEQFKDKIINFKSSDGSKKTVKMPNADLGFLKAKNCTVNFENVCVDGGQTYDDYVYLDPQNAKTPVTKDLISLENGAKLTLGKATVIEHFVGLLSCAIASDGSTVIMNAGAKISDCSSYSRFNIPPGQNNYYTYGGAMRLTNNSKLTVNSGSIYGCNCYSDRKAYGGAIYSSDSSIEFLAGSIKNCRTVSGAHDPNGHAYGGAIYAKNSDLSLVNGSISSCRAMEAEGINADRKGYAIYLTGACKYSFGAAFKINLHSDDKNIPNNLDEKVVGLPGIYIDGSESQAQAQPQAAKRYEIPIEGQESLFMDENQLETPLLEYLLSNLVRSEDGAVLSKVKTEDGVEITEETKLKDIVLAADGANLTTKKLIPTYDENSLRVSSYSMLQKAIYEAKGDRRIILASDIEINSERQAASGTNKKYCFADNDDFSKNITIESADANNPSVIKILESNLGLFALKNATLTLKNIKLDGGDFDSTNEKGDFINISERSVLNLEEGASIENVRKNKNHVIHLEGGKLNINGGYITKCVNCSDGHAYGGAVYSDSGTVCMTSGGIVDCCAKTKKSSSDAFGGGICAMSGSSLKLEGGVVSGCYVGHDGDVTGARELGDAIYFDDADGEYAVVSPNGNLKINTPDSCADNSHNSDVRVLGYRGIYRTDVLKTVGDENEIEYCEIKLDVDGGVDDHDISPVYVLIPTKNEKSPLKDFLPSDLKKGEATISKWTYEKDGKITDLADESVKEMVEILGENPLKPIYYAKEEHVSSPQDLQRAIYGAQGDKVIILNSDIIVTAELLEAKGNSDLEDSFANAQSGYYLSDNKSVEKSIVIKSEDQGPPKTISSKNPALGLLALQNGTLTLENVIIDGLGCDDDENDVIIQGEHDYIEISDGSTLNLNQGLTIKNVYRKDSRVIYLNGGRLNIDGGYITECSVNYDSGFACGGAVYSKGGTVCMTSGGIVDCRAVVTESGSAAFGGGIYAIEGSMLELKGGIIIGCDIQGDSKDSEIKSRGNEIYFEAGGEYDVAAPNGNLKINIPAGYDNSPYNSDARVLGYQGIYHTQVSSEVQDSQTKYYEILIDADDGCDESGNHCGNAVYVEKSVKDTRVLKYLPDFLKKGDSVLSGWDKGGVRVNENARISDFLQEGSETRTEKLKAIYAYENDQVSVVSEYSQLQEAIYNARGQRTIILNANITIDDSAGSDGNLLYPEAASVKNENGENKYPCALSGYCFCDDGIDFNKMVTIKSADGKKFTITNKKAETGLFAIKGGGFKFENVVLDGDGLDKSSNFMDISKNVTLEIGPGAEIKNVKSADGYSAIKLVGAKLNLSDGCKISGCSGSNGGAINASDGSEVNVLGGLLTNCQAVNGGLIYAVDSSLNFSAGEVFGCFASANGDVVYFSGDASLTLAEPNGKLKITIPLPSNDHNSDGKVFGYWGIYKEGIGAQADNSADSKYYELEIDANGGVDKYGNSTINSVYISNEKLQSETPILKYLPTDLTKYGAGVAKWVYCVRDIDVTSDTNMKYVDLEDCDVVFNKVKAIYDDVHVSTYLQLQRLIYEAKDDMTIVLDNDLEIVDGDDSNYPNASAAVNDAGELKYPNAKLNCCFCDDSNNTNHKITIKSAKGSKFKIINKKLESSLIALRGGTLSFENVILDGAGVEASKDLINLSDGATLSLDSETVIQNVNRKGDSCVIYLEGCSLYLNHVTIQDCFIYPAKGGGCAIRATENANGVLSVVKIVDSNIKNCLTSAFESYGGAIFAQNTELTIINSNITDCFANGVNIAHGGAIYINKGKLSVESGTISGCRANVGAYGGQARGDAIYINGSEPVEGKEEMIAKANGGLTISLPSDLDNDYHNLSVDVYGYPGIWDVDKAGDVVSLEDVFGGCLANKECVYGDVYSLNDISANGVDGVKYEVVEGKDVASIDNGANELKILGVGTFKLKATTRGTAYVETISVKPKDLVLVGIEPNDKEYDQTAQATYKLSFDEERNDFKSIEDAYRFIRDKKLYDGDGKEENRVLNVLKKLGFDLVNVQDANVLSRYLDKIVVEFDDSSAGQDKNVRLKIVGLESVPAELLSIWEGKYKLSIAVDRRDKKLYDGDGKEENRVLNVLKKLGFDLVNVQDANVLSRYLDKIVVEFDDSSAGQDKNVRLKIVDLESAPAELLDIWEGKYKLSLAADCRASIAKKVINITGIKIVSKEYDGTTKCEYSETPCYLDNNGVDMRSYVSNFRLEFKDPEVGEGKEIVVRDVLLTSGFSSENYELKCNARGTIFAKEVNVVVKLNGQEKFFNVLTTKDLNASSKFRLFFKDKCSIEIVPTDDSGSISSIYYFKSSDAYANIVDLNKNANWLEGKSDNVDCQTSFNANGDIARFALEISKASDGEKFFAYFKIVGKDDNVKYLRSDGIVLYNEITPLTKEISYFKKTLKNVDIYATLNKNKINQLMNITKNIKYPSGEGYFKIKPELDGLNVNYTVFYWVDEGTHDFKVSYMPGCCEESDIGDLNDLPSFDFRATINP